MDNQISVRQTACFCVFSMLALKLITLPSLLFENAKSSGIMVALILFIVDFVVLYIFLKTKEKYPNLSLFELIKKVFGKVVAKILYVGLFIFFICKVSMLMNEAISYMQAIVDEEYNLIMFLLTYMTVITAIAYSGLKNTARTTEFGFVFIIIGLIICLFLSEVTQTFGELGPVFEEGPLKLGLSAFKLNFWFSDFLFVAVLSDKIKPTKNMKKTIFSYVIMVAVLLAVLYLIYFRLFRVTAYLHKNAIADLTQYNRNIGNVGNIDIVAILVYLFIIFFQGSLYFNCLNIAYEKIFDYSNKIHSLIVVNLILVFLELFVFFNLERLITFILNYFNFVSLFFFVRFQRRAKRRNGNTLLCLFASLVEASQDCKRACTFKVF